MIFVRTNVFYNYLRIFCSSSTWRYQVSFCNWKELAVSVKSFDEIKGIVENAVPDKYARNAADCNGTHMSVHLSNWFFVKLSIKYRPSQLCLTVFYKESKPGI